MYRSHGFNAYLTEYKPVANKDGNVEIKVTLKYEADGEVQNFLKSVDRVLGIDKYAHYFESAIIWDSIEFSDELKIKSEMEIEFGEAFPAFDVVFDSVKVTRKIKEGLDCFVYTLKFTKEISEGNIDISIAGAYLNAKRPDENGKEKKVPFHFKMKSLED